MKDVGVVVITEVLPMKDVGVVVITEVLPMKDVGVVVTPTSLATVHHHPKQLVSCALLLVFYIIINDFT